MIASELLIFNKRSKNPSYLELQLDSTGKLFTLCVVKSELSMLFGFRML